MSLDKPHYELRRVLEHEPWEAQIVPVTDVPWHARADRRAFLGAGVAATLVVGALTRADRAAAAAGKQRFVSVVSVGANTCSGGLAHLGAIRSLAVSPDGKTLLSGGENPSDIFPVGEAKVWTLPAGALTRKLERISTPVNAVVIAPDSRTAVVASGSSDEGGGAVKVWDLSRGAGVRRLDSATADNVDRFFSLALSRDGTTVATGATDGADATIRLWNLRTGRSLGRIPTVVAIGLAFSADGRILASGGLDSPKITLWRVSDRKRLATLDGHTDSILALAVTRDGKTLISASADHTIRLWRLPDGAPLGVLRGHTDRVRSLALSTDGKVLASGSYDKTVKVWNVAKRSLVRTFTGHTAAVFGVAITPNGTTLVSGSLDRTLRLWPLSGSDQATCLLDLDASPTSVKGATYHATNAAGVVVTYTAPCGTPIPPGAVCTCNCVPGKIAPTPVPAPSSGGGGGGGGTTTQPCGTPIPPGYICTCNCIPSG